MPLHAIPPGKRKGNKTWLFRGRIAGKVVEASSALTAKATAREVREAQAEAEREVWRQHEARRVPRPGENTTWGVAAKHYLALKDPENRNRPLRLKIEKLRPHLGNRPLASITGAELTDLANRLYPHVKLSSRNDLVIIPAAAVLHFAARQNWCPWIKVSQFKRPHPETRSVSDEIAATLVNSLPAGSYERLFLLWIFRHGNRITEALQVEWGKIDLRHQTVEVWVQKRQEWRTKPLQDEVYEVLAAIPEAERTGFLFPWRNRNQVYDRWLRKYTKQLGIRFTPHMARHTVGRWLNRDGHGLKTIMETMDHIDPRSSVRYQSVDIDTVRNALRTLGKRRGT